MKNIVVKIVVGILVAGAAGGGGYLLWRRSKRRKQEENEPLEVIRMPYQPVNKKDIVRDEDDKKTKTTDIRKEKFARQVSAYVQTEGEKENFEAYLSGMESPEEDDPEEDDPEEEDEDDDIPEHTMQNPDSDGPYQITAGEFCNNRTYYDKVSLNYFGDDQVVSDDRDEIMENADKILGDIQGAFAGPYAPSVIYIRNEALEVDYEISFVDGSYRREVLQLNEEG